MIDQVQSINPKNKTRNLILGIIFDAIGMLSFTFLYWVNSQISWAPIAACCDNNVQE
jgi:hypothetical protein